MTIILNFFIAGLLAWLGYKLIRMVITSIKLGIEQANRLERQFGTNILGAAKYTFGGQIPKDKENG